MIREFKVVPHKSTLQFIKIYKVKMKVKLYTIIPIKILPMSLSEG